MSVHVHVRMLSLHLLHHVHLLVFLKLCNLLLGKATGVILQYGLLKVCRDHAVAAHIERTHLSGHYRLLP